MSNFARHAETAERRLTMLRSAFSGVLLAALAADDVTEILANADGSIWIERRGQGVLRSEETIDAEARERIIRLVANGVGETCDRANPIISAELPGCGARFEGLLPPVSTAPCFAIRKPATVLFTLDDYVRGGALAPAVAEMLRYELGARSNILIAGGTSSGKTTFTNALLCEPVFDEERVVTLEDTRELKCAAQNVIALRTHGDSVTLSCLVKSTMRLRPDRIIVGEVRGGEALDLLKAWNTGHPGGVTTLHANSAEAALTRLEQLVAEATQNLPRRLIAEAVDVIIFMARCDGLRRVEEALRVIGVEGNQYVFAPLCEPKLMSKSQGEIHELC